MFQELRDILSARFHHHRDPGFQAFVLPLCQPLIEAIGYRIAYDAAVEDGIDEAILNMFVASIIREDRAWFSEVGGISRAKQMDSERNAMEALCYHVSTISSQAWTLMITVLPQLYRTRSGRNTFKVFQRLPQQVIHQAHDHHPTYNQLGRCCRTPFFLNDNITTCTFQLS